jgi:nicotinate-nucleotide adenylyltransferase
MARTLFYGGSFDPIHYGHLRCARAVADKAGFASVVLVPSWRSPHKPDSTSAALPVDRLAMCKLVTSYDEKFQVDEIEIRRGGPSYTLDTVRALKAASYSEVNWLIGADQLAALPRWRDPQALISEANLYIMHRPGYPMDWSVLPGWLQPLRRNVIEVPQVDLSSTEIRERVARGESISDAVPPGVEQYIREHGLYRDSIDHS